MIRQIAGFFRPRLLPIVAGLCLLWVVRAAYQFFIEKYSSWIGPIFLSVVVLLALLHLLREPLTRLPQPVFLGAVLILFLASRLVWDQAILTEPSSDFAAYDTLAKAYASGRPAVSQLPWSYFAYSQGYPLVLAGWYSLFGPGLSAAKALNLVLGIGAMAAFYVLARSFSEQTARIASLLFCLWPTQLTFSSVLASEHLALFLFLTGLVFLLAAGAGEGRRSLIFYLVAGGLLALAYTCRGALALGFLAGIALILATPTAVIRKAISLAALITGFLLVMGIFIVSVQKVYGYSPATQGYSTLLSGTNFASKGGWNQRDGQAFLNHATLKDANRDALNTALRRITSNPWHFRELILIKLPRLWEDETYGVYWSTLNLVNFPLEKVFFTRKVWAGLSQGFHLGMLALSIIVAWQAARYGRSHPALVLVWLVFLGGLLFHAFFEVQARYHYWMEPLFILLSAVGISDSLTV